jgi:hypothetical protein
MILSTGLAVGPTDDIVKWTDEVATLLSGLGVLCTLVMFIFVFHQTRCQMRQTNAIVDQLAHAVEANRSTLYQSTMREMQQISRIFLQHPELWPYFYADVPVPADVPAELATRIRVISEMFVDFAGFTVNTYDPFKGPEKDGWLAYFADIARTSPAVRSYWREHRGWYEPPLRAVFDPVVGSVVDVPAQDRLAPAS